LAAQVDPNRKIGYVGIRWPAELWRDEPIPEFDAAPADDHQGAAALDNTATFEAGSPTIDPAQLADLKQMFPNGSEQLDTIAAAFASRPLAASRKRLRAHPLPEPAIGNVYSRARSRQNVRPLVTRSSRRHKEDRNVQTVR